MGDPGEHDELRAALEAERRTSYDADAALVAVPHPRLPLTSDHRDDQTGAAIGCLVLVLGVVYLGNLVDVAILDGDQALLALARTGMVACLVGIPLLVWRMKRRSGIALVRGDVARAWLDLREGLRLGALEPGNPGWGVALAHAARVQDVMRHELRRLDESERPLGAGAEEVRRAGAATWAASEAWRRAQAGRRHDAVSPLDRLPVALGPTYAQASAASDAAADAGTLALGHGDYDLDFEALSRRRAAMHARATGPSEEARDPRQVLLVDTGWGLRTRRLARASLVVFVVSGVVASLLLMWQQALASLLSVVPALGAVVVALRLPLTAADPALVRMPPDVAMAWRDYLDAVAYADSGRAAVPTVEAIRGCEQRVRALVIELIAPTLSPTERPVLAAELFDLCSGAWTLVGQERAESRLLDDLDDLDDPA